MVFIQHHHSMKDSLTLFDRIAGTPSPRSNRFVPALRDSSAPRSSRDGLARESRARADHGARARDERVVERVVERVAALRERVDAIASVEDVGSYAWRARRAATRRLRAVAYEEAMDGRECDRDSVASVVSSAGDGIVEEGLVRDLLRAETWRVETLPRATRLAARETTTTEEDDGALAYALYLTAYHETVCNLLELVVFANGGEWMVNASDEVTAELVEYCHRAATRVVGDADDGRDDEAMMLLERVQEIEFALSMTCLGILRSVTDVIADVSLGVRARLLDSLDVVSALATLLEKKPWIRRTRDDEAALEIYTDGAWRRVGKTEEWDASLRVQKYEAQVWLSLRALLCDASCRRGYAWDEQRKSTVLKLGRYLNETKMDQLPVLRDLAGVLEEIRALDVTNVTDASRGFILEIVPSLRRAFTSKSPEYFDRVAETMLRERFNSESPDFKRTIAEDLLEACETLSTTPRETTTELETTTTTGDSNAAAPVRVDIMRERRSLNDSEISFDLIRALEYDFTEDDPVEVRTSSTRTRGLRRKLSPRTDGRRRDDPLPAFDGKIRVTHDARTITTSLSLRTLARGNSHAWITIGALAADGFAAQLRLDANRPGDDDAVGYRLTDAYVTIAVP